MTDDDAAGEAREGATPPRVPGVSRGDDEVGSIWIARFKHAIGWLPVAILVAVALSHCFFVYRDNLVIWTGGGFGMFSSVEGVSLRRVEVYDREGNELEVPSGRSWPERRVGVHPSERNLWAFARHVDGDLEEMGLEKRVGSVVVYGTRFEGEPLRPIRYLANELVVPKK